ncbi:murein DD-endopeptidase MepM/ murein hydrolase activator NlpD [Microterricola gilva]|uniref:Murein DD-endopeptidase MepM/ murein hydrolase activator NlpD n=1 Tax=Microterricola gilva TaxID=393267 RepID=A0A4Q8APX4_9MICO|nr:peptidoglycan DD-metalloendopeptidase family protein [Microterricola gilva]RZU66648.1 murein DD-endopeptidase MepM/ murein hydrolase activator NlpD [Microterricola gilva]
MLADTTAPDAPASGTGVPVQPGAADADRPLTRREIRERERAIELAAQTPLATPPAEQQPAEPSGLTATAVLPIVPEVPTRTAVIPIATQISQQPEPAPRTAASYSALLESLVLPTPEAAPLATAQSFATASQASISIPTAEQPPAVATEFGSSDAPALRRSRRAASVDFDIAPTPTVSADFGGEAGTPRASWGLGPMVADVSPRTAPVPGPRRRSTAAPADSDATPSAPSASAPSAQAQAQAPAAPASNKASALRPLGRRIVAKTSVVVAMGFVALMAVATSVPAEALLTADDVKAATLLAQSSSSNEPGQSIVASGDSITVQTDGYETSTIAEAAAASGIRMEATFVNNPAGSVQWPFLVGVHVGDRFGYRDCAGCSSNHGGQDFNPGLGAEIQSIADGVVTLAEDGEGSLGVHMMIEHQINGETITSVYAHMQHGTMRYSVGDVVKVGDVIGNTGNTGMSTGPHLHFEIRLGGINGTKVDPLDWLYANTN